MTVADGGQDRIWGMRVEDEGTDRVSNGRCCWHCRHYTRPLPLVMIGRFEPPWTCKVDRSPDCRWPTGDLQPGDKPMPADGWCERFEFDPPPAPHPTFV